MGAEKTTDCHDTTGYSRKGPLSCKINKIQAILLDQFVNMHLDVFSMAAQRQVVFIPPERFFDFFGDDFQAGQHIKDASDDGNTGIKFYR
jgi:hypothetical protein